MIPGAPPTLQMGPFGLTCLGSKVREKLWFVIRLLVLRIGCILLLAALGQAADLRTMARLGRRRLVTAFVVLRMVCRLGLLLVRSGAGM